MHVQQLKILNTFNINNNDLGLVLTVPKYNKFFVISYDVQSFINLWRETNSFEETKELLGLGKHKDEEIINLIGPNLFRCLIDKYEKNKDKNKDTARDRYIKLKVTIIPKQITEFLCKPLQHLFKLNILIAFLIWTALIVFLTFINIENLRKYNAITFYIVYFFFNAVFHELGHAASLYKFKKKSCKIGWGMYLLTPVLFSDVTSAWSLKKQQRLIINIAGFYFEIIALTISTTVALILKIDPSYLLTIYAFRFIFEFNPLYRSDGYWLVSDFFTIPNLTKKALEELKRVFKNFEKPQNLGLFIYALASYTFIFFFVGSIILEYGFKTFTFPKDLYFNVIIGPESILSFVTSNFLITSIYILLGGFIIKGISKIFKLLKAVRL